jgi:hypothetical protein
MKLNSKVAIVISGLLEIIKVPFFIAGGSLVRFNNNSDVDVFFYSEEDYRTAVTNIPEKYRIVHSGDSDLLSSLAVAKTMVQLVGFNVGTMQEVIDTFDLNKSKVAYDPYTKEFLVDPSVKLPLHIVEGNIRKSTPDRFIKYYENKISSVEQSQVDILTQIKTVLNADNVIDYYKQELLVDFPKERLLVPFFNYYTTKVTLVNMIDPVMLYRLCKAVFYSTYIDYIYDLLSMDVEAYKNKKSKLYAVLKAFTEDQPSLIVNSYISPSNTNFKDPYSRIPLFKQEYPELFL